MALVANFVTKGSSDIVLLAISKNYDFQSTAYKGLTFTDDNKMKSDLFSIVSGMSIEGTDFAGTITFNQNITVKKAGTYEINNNGTISTITLSANGTVTPPWSSISNYWSIRKIS